MFLLRHSRFWIPVLSLQIFLFREHDCIQNDGWTFGWLLLSDHPSDRPTNGHFVYLADRADEEYHDDDVFVCDLLPV